MGLSDSIDAIVLDRFGFGPLFPISGQAKPEVDASLPSSG